MADRLPERSDHEFPGHVRAHRGTRSPDHGRQGDHAIGVIKEQGEGTSASPENAHPGEAHELAHFYAFRAIYHGHKLAGPVGVRRRRDPHAWLPTHGHRAVRWLANNGPIGARH
ncbi:ferritin-like domain-containing protein [Streptomyces flaveolus]|uniref:ferritin-like domain-containing protein n=1 Tax=Streptomyces flaveolus TaxID=67297 RepID=UPI0034481129